jgi:HEAT repeat protein
MSHMRPSLGEMTGAVAMILRQRLSRGELAPPEDDGETYDLDDDEEFLRAYCPELRRAIVRLYGAQGGPPLSNCIGLGHALGHVDSVVAKELRAGLSDPSPAVRRTAIRLLAALDRGSGEDISAIAHGLVDEDESVRMAAERAFGEIRYTPEFHNKFIQQVLTRFRPRSLLLADSRLIFVHRGAPEILDAIMEALADASATARHNGAAAVQELGDVLPERVMPLLLRMTRDADDEARRTAVETVLARAGAEVAEPVLRETLRDPVPGVRRLAMRYAPRVFEGRERAALKLMLAGLEDPFEEVRWEAAGTLDDLGDVAQEARPALKEKARSDPASWVRDEAVRALEALGRLRPLPRTRA